MKKIYIAVLIILLSILCCTISYCEKISNDLQNNIFRLHVIANSNSEHDQKMKLLVRDEIIKYMNNNINDITNINQCINYIKNNTNDINVIIQKVFDENKYNMNFSIYIDKEFFPTKKYDNFSFPSGIYNCLKIQIGESMGKNWWCVIYPNLCITNESIKSIENTKLKQTINLETYKLVTSDISYKFKILEIYENLKYGVNI